ncbi:MAG: YhjD/YihY/BrkB family envelope integrity protein [Acidobacteriota bacterium]
MSRTFRRLAQFFAELARAQHRDLLMVHSAALAYTTLLSLVPVLTVLLVSAVGNSPSQFEQLLGAIGYVLPFTSTQVQKTLVQFAQRTAHLGSIAVVVSFLVAINLFYQIEEVINAIWGVPQRRKLRWRLASFVALLIWGPVLLVVLFSGLYWVSSRPWYPSVAWLGRPLPAVFSVAVLTLLYHLVPHTKVPWRAAAVGAGVATGAMLAIHLGFQTYLAAAGKLNVIYGSLSLLLLFLVSLYLFWFALMLGVEASWVVGHRPTPIPAPQVEAVIAVLLETQRDGVLSRERAHAALGDRAPDILALLTRVPEILLRSRGGFQLARSAEEITVADVVHRVCPDSTSSWTERDATLATLAKEKPHPSPAVTPRNGATGTNDEAPAGDAGPEPNLAGNPPPVR